MDHAILSVRINKYIFVHISTDTYFYSGNETDILCASLNFDITIHNIYVYRQQKIIRASSVTNARIEIVSYRDVICVMEIHSLIILVYVNITYFIYVY